MGRNQSSLDGGKMLTGSGNERSNTKQNFHPCVKPIALMEYLIKMVTPVGGIVLDPFAGSGSTGVACKNTNRNYILIEKEEEYIPIINKRLESM
jgi:site-specific DNA-methyltransferase (adenine-specific)